MDYSDGKIISSAVLEGFAKVSVGLLLALFTLVAPNKPKEHCAAFCSARLGRSRATADLVNEGGLSDIDKC